MTAFGSLTFVGNATTVLRIGGFTLLTDPNFVRRGERVHLGYGMWTRRLRDPALTPAQLPDLDAIVLSHLHGDHFDRVARRELAKDLPLVTTPHAARWLGRAGFTACDGLRPWATTELTRDGERLRITSVPGRHGPGVVNALLPPVMGSVLELERGGTTALRVYVTGDTLCVDELRAVRERFPGVDVMITHLGGTRILGMLLSMDDEQGVELMRHVRPTTTVPVHTDDYRVQRSPLSAFLDAARRADLHHAVTVPRRGETVPLLSRRPA